MPKFKVGELVLHLLANKYTPVIIDRVFSSKGGGFRYGIRYLDGGSSFAWDEEEFFTKEEVVARVLAGEKRREWRGVTYA
jgi:hypothetical protein